MDAVFEGGPLDAHTVPVPARVAPPLIVGVLMNPAGKVIDIRASNELPATYVADGWAEYWQRFRSSVSTCQPHTFTHRPR